MQVRTIVPLLSSAPLAQKELVRTSRGCTVLVSRFHSAPHAECPLICSGSSDARSKKMTRVGDTTIASSATIPEVSFLRSNRQLGALGTAGAARASEENSAKAESTDHFIASSLPESMTGAAGGAEYVQAEGEETSGGAYIANDVSCRSVETRRCSQPCGYQDGRWECSDSPAACRSMSKFRGPLRGCERALAICFAPIAVCPRGHKRLRGLCERVGRYTIFMVCGNDCQEASRSTSS